MVSTVTQSFFSKHFEPWGLDSLRSCQWLKLRAANGLDIPYIGYLELDVELCDSQPVKCRRVKVRGGQIHRIPGGTMKLVPATCSEQFSGGSVLFEPPEAGLPAGLLASPALVKVTRGTGYIPVVNVGTSDVLLYPRTNLGTLCSALVVSLPSGVTEVDVMTATVASQAVVNPTYYQIPLSDDVPVRQRHRRIPPTEYEVVKAHINQLLEARVIRESSSPYASPIVLVKKKDGSLRMCVDYRLLNAKTRKDAFPLPRIEESLDALSGARWFWPVVAQHLERLDLVLGWLQQEGLKAKLEKCSFFKQEVSYLGHVISSQGVATDPSKIEAVAGWRHPGTVSELRSFLGFTSCYYRRFVEGFAELAAPLHKLVAELAGTKSRKGLERSFSSSWSERCQYSFDELKRWLTTAPVLAYADFNLPFILKVDASHSGLGAVLSQEQGGKVRPVAYASRGLRPTERNMTNYSSMKLEFLALKWAMTEKFREYLLGHHCTVYTDNNPLSHLSSAKLGALEQRWAAQLASFDFEIKYRSGRHNRNADALSCQFPLEPTGPEVLTQGTAIPTLLRRALEAESVAEATQAVVTALPGHTLSEVGSMQWDRLVVREGVLYRRVFWPDGAEDLQLVLPICLRKEVLTYLHQEHGHQGIERTMELVRKRCYWPGMSADVARWCLECERCQIAKDTQPRARTFMGHLLASRPQEVLAIDFTLLEPSRLGLECSVDDCLVNTHWPSLLGTNGQ
ncbi:hypothetical protein SRHO_G00147150 [Serrasalmus rhombeus]